MATLVEKPAVKAAFQSFLKSPESRAYDLQGGLNSLIANPMEQGVLVRAMATYMESQQEGVVRLKQEMEQARKAVADLTAKQAQSEAEAKRTISVADRYAPIAAQYAKPSPFQAVAQNVVSAMASGQAPAAAAQVSEDDWLPLEGDDLGTNVVAAAASGSAPAGPTLPRFANWLHGDLDVMRKRARGVGVGDFSKCREKN